MNKRYIKIGVAGMFLIAGILLVASVDWKLAVGTFLILWSHNLEKH